MNKLSEAAKFLIIAGTILIVCSLVVVGFFVMKEGKEGTNNSMAQFGTITSNHSDVELEKYHNLAISGTTLASLLNDKLVNNHEKYQYTDIKYATLLSATVATIDKTTFESTMKSKSSARYINPVGSFKGQVIKDGNGVITAIEFTQVKK